MDLHARGWIRMTGGRRGARGGGYMYLQAARAVSQLAVRRVLARRRFRHQRVRDRTSFEVHGRHALRGVRHGALEADGGRDHGLGKGLGQGKLGRHRRNFDQRTVHHGS